MAKLNAPLFSFGASGAIGNALVFFPWKGLNVVRQYVVPANPKSQAQIDQRALVTASVLEIHDAMVYAPGALRSLDKSAYSRAGSLHATPRTWFNEAIKIMVDAMVDAQLYSAFTMCQADYLAATTATVTGRSVKEAAMTGFVKYGTSKSALLSSVTGDVTNHLITATMTGLTLAITYYWQWQATPVAGKTVLKSGIYVYKHEA